MDVMAKSGAFREVEHLVEELFFRGSTVNSSMSSCMRSIRSKDFLFRLKQIKSVKICIH